MGFQPALATNVNITTDSACQVLLAMGTQSDNVKGAKYSAGQGGHKTPNLTRKQSFAPCPPMLKHDALHVCEGLKNPSRVGKPAGG